MFENFNYYKAEKFLLETKQYPYILQAVRGLRPYDEIELLDMIESKKPCDYYLIEKLYCKIMHEMNYNVPFSLEELFYCIKSYPKIYFKKFNQQAFEYVCALYKKLKCLYPI